MRNFLLGCVVGAAGLYGSMCFHIVRAADGHHFIPKTGLTFKDSYVDIRNFNVTSWRDHIALADAIMKSDKAQLFQGSASTAVENALDNLLQRR